ncbi:hypothetical protein [Polaromonas sp. C04]|nr:hypothetical protein [Polaromonas sp. C04]
MECYRIGATTLVFNSKYNGVREARFDAFNVDTDTGILHRTAKGLDDAQ